MTTETITDKVVAVDIGGTNTRVALCDLRGRVLGRRRQPSHVGRNAHAILESITKSIQNTAPTMNHVIGMAIGVPGTVDSAGVVHEAENLRELQDVSLKAYFESNFDTTIRVGNDASLAGLGEHRYGAGRDARNMVYVTVGTGIGGSVITDGRQVKGARGFASEVGGQLLANPVLDGGLCVKSLQDVASGKAIRRRAMEMVQTRGDSKINKLVNGKIEDVTAEIVARAAKRGDPIAKEIIQSAGIYVGLGIVNLVHIFNPELVVVGGGVMNAGGLIFGPMKKTVKKFTIRSMREGLRISPSKLGDDAGLLGGVAMIVDGIATGDKLSH